MGSSIKTSDFKILAISDEKLLVNFQNINCDSPCPFLEAALLCSFLAKVPKHGRERPVPLGGKGCWTLDVEQVPGKWASVPALSLSFLIFFHFL